MNKSLFFSPGRHLPWFYLSLFNVVVDLSTPVDGGLTQLSDFRILFITKWSKSKKGTNILTTSPWAIDRSWRFVRVLFHSRPDWTRAFLSPDLSSHDSWSTNLTKIRLFCLGPIVFSYSGLLSMKLLRNDEIGQVSLENWVIEDQLTCLFSFVKSA